MSNISIWYLFYFNRVKSAQYIAPQPAYQERRPQPPSNNGASLIWLSCPHIPNRPFFPSRSTSPNIATLYPPIPHIQHHQIANTIDHGPLITRIPLLPRGTVTLTSICTYIQPLDIIHDQNCITNPKTQPNQAPTTSQFSKKKCRCPNPCLFFLTQPSLTIPSSLLRYAPVELNKSHVPHPSLGFPAPHHIVQSIAKSRRCRPTSRICMLWTHNDDACSSAHTWHKLA